MTKNNKIRLGNKDSLLRNWWENALEQGENISKTIVLAMEYYRLTGNFLTIGETTEPTKIYEPTVKYVYISSETELYSWLEKRKNAGEKVSTIIRYILRNSLKKAEEVKIYSLDILYKEVDLIKNQPPKIITQNQYIPSAEVITPTVNISANPSGNRYIKEAPKEEDVFDKNDILSKMIGDISDFEVD